MVWDIYGQSLEVINMGRAMVHICLLCGFEMGSTALHIKPIDVSLFHSVVYCYGMTVYFVKVHTLSTAFCLGMVLVCPIAVP